MNATIKRTPEPFVLSDTRKLPNPSHELPGLDDDFQQRATFYFNEEQLLKLDVVMLKMRTEQRVKFGKSEIMRAALDFIVQDFKLNVEESWVMQRLCAISTQE